LILIAEPDNQTDQYAVEIDYQSKKLGYIPKNKKRTIRKILHSGVELYVKVYKVDAEQHSWNAVQVSVFMVV